MEAIQRGSGKNRRTLKFLDSYPTPENLTERTVTSQGWTYKTRQDFYKTRDMAFVAVLYVLAVRISEGVRLTRGQFTVKRNKIEVRSIKLSKTRKNGKPRVRQFRPYAFIALHGSRENLGFLVKNYLDFLDREGAKPEDRLFKFGTRRGLQIVTATLGVPAHWLRAYGEDFLYDLFRKDLLAVADYVSVDPRTLSHYLRKGYTKYPEG